MSHHSKDLVTDLTVKSGQLFLAFNCSGAGHYDGTEALLQVDNSDLNPETTENMCRCGINNKPLENSTKTSKSFCRNTRCTCVKQGRKCTLCKCQNCSNKDEKKNTKKRTLIRSKKMPRTTGSKFLSDSGLVPRGASWSMSENILLSEIAKEHSEI